MAGIVTIIFVVGIFGLFWLDRDSKARTSIALWIPWLWMAIACSRPVSQWLDMGGGTVTVDAVMDGSPIDRAVFIGLELIGLVVLASRRRRVGQMIRSPAIQAILVYFAYALASVVWSDYPDVAIKRWIKAIGDLEMVLIVLSDLRPVDAIKRLFAWMAYVLIPLSVLVIKYYPAIGVQWSPWGGRGSYGGITTNKNALGAVCLCLGLASLWHLCNAYQDRALTGRGRRMLAHGSILAMVVWLFLIADSVTSETTFLMAGVLLLVVRLRSVIRRPAIAHVLLALMVAVSASIVFLGASSSALKSLGRNPTLTDRTEVWEWIFSLVHNPLLGTGFESFWLGWRLNKMWNVYWWHPNEAHNGYIEIYANLGWLGIALLVVILVVEYRSVLHAWRRDIALNSLGLAYFFVALVYNYTEAALFKMQAPVWLFFLLAVASVPGDSYRAIRPLGKKQAHEISPFSEEID